MSLQTATHPSLPPSFPQPPYPGALEKRTAMSTTSEQSIQPAIATGPEPARYNGSRGEYEFSLVIDQQPIRARMCGFGDKDRRPITPPPCVRVIVKNLRTGEEVPAEEINPSFFLLSVDLWDENATSEKNIVRASTNSPAVSISTATTTSFPVPPERPLYSTPYSPANPMYPQQYPVQPGAQYPQGQPGAPYAPGQPQAPYAQGGVYPQTQPHASIYPNSQGGYYPPGYAQPYPGQPGAGPSGYAPQVHGQQPPGYPPPAQQNAGMFTRNLIGSLAVNSFTLKDLNGKLGHWFILQDLSVRTEGSFRLKMSFIDIGTHATPIAKEENKLNHGKTTVLASVFSQPFHVFSAKKFPGVIESTPLSKAFAQQGIKIPIRKDGVKGEPREEEED